MEGMVMSREDMLKTWRYEQRTELGEREERVAREIGMYGREKLRQLSRRNDCMLKIRTHPPFLFSVFVAFLSSFPFFLFLRIYLFILFLTTQYSSFLQSPFSTVVSNILYLRPPANTTHDSPTHLFFYRFFYCISKYIKYLILIFVLILPFY